MGLYLVFILGANTAPIPYLCGISAALLQYFLLVFFAWTTAEAFYLYQKLVKVLGVKKRSRLVLKIGLIIWCTFQSSTYNIALTILQTYHNNISWQHQMIPRREG